LWVDGPGRQDMKATDHRDVTLRLAVQVGLQFNITPSMRGIFASLQGNVLKLVAYFDKDPTQEERDLLVDAASEVSGQFPELLDVEVECVWDARAFDELPKKGALVYARHEPSV
jgi:hypothetical protein